MLWNKKPTKKKFPSFLHRLKGGNIKYKKYNTGFHLNNITIAFSLRTTFVRS